MRLWKILGALVLVAALSSAAFASAAKLNLNSQGVQAGNIPVSGCQGDAAVSVSYHTVFSNAVSAQFYIDGVTVSGIADACFAAGAPIHTIDVVLTGGGPPYPLDCGTVPITGSSVTYTAPDPCLPTPASTVTDVHVLIK
jgi:hypothetical protein